MSYQIYIILSETHSKNKMVYGIENFLFDYKIEIF